MRSKESGLSPRSTASISGGSTTSGGLSRRSLSVSSDGSASSLSLTTGRQHSRSSSGASSTGSRVVGGQSKPVTAATVAPAALTRKTSTAASTKTINSKAGSTVTVKQGDGQVKSLSHSQRKLVLDTRGKTRVNAEYSMWMSNLQEEYRDHVNVIEGKFHAKRKLIAEYSALRKKLDTEFEEKLRSLDIHSSKTSIASSAASRRSSMTACSQATRCNSQHGPTSMRTLSKRKTFYV